VTSTISMNIGTPNNQINAEQTTPGYGNDTLRGFFVINVQ